jgi:hypothetical protein
MNKKMILLISLVLIFSSLGLPIFALTADYTVVWNGSESFTYTNNQRAITRDSTGKLHCVYNRDQIFYSYSLDNGETWTEELVSSGSGTHYYPALAVDSKDNIHVVWFKNSGSEVLQYRMRTKAGIWGTQEGIPNTDVHQKCPSIAVDSEDNVHVVWMANENRIRYSVKTGSGWKAVPEEITDSAYAYQICPTIAIDAEDNLHVAWAGKGWGSNPTIYNIYYKSKPKGGSWGSIELITDEGMGQGFYSPYMGPSIAIDTRGNIHVVWTGQGWGTYTSYYNIQYRSMISGTWRNIESISDIDQTQINPIIAVDKCDNIHVVWSGKGWGDDQGNSSIQYVNKTNNEWSIQETLAKHSEDDSSHSGHPTIPNMMWAMHPLVQGLRPCVPNEVLPVIFMSTGYHDPPGYVIYRLVYVGKQLFLKCDGPEPVGGEILQSTVQSIGIWVLVVLSIIGLSVQIAYKKQKIIH